MLKRYSYNGLTYQWEEGEQPKGAIELKEAAPKTRERRPTNKARAKKAE